MKKLLTIAGIVLLSASAAFGQSVGKLQPGNVWGNSGASAAYGSSVSIASLLSAGTGIAVTGTTTATISTNIAFNSNTLGGNVALNNTSNYFTGPTVAQGTSGTWFATGTVTVTDTAGATNIDCKLWDGTTVIASARASISAANLVVAIALSGILASPAGNIRISCKDNANTSGSILFNATGNGADSKISVIRLL